MGDNFSGFIGFQWNGGNTNKNLLKHNVQNWESEQIFFNKPLLAVFSCDPVTVHSFRRPVCH